MIILCKNTMHQIMRIKQNEKLFAICTYNNFFTCISGRIEKKYPKMVKLMKNDFHGINGDFIKSFYSKKQADCILYSNEGSQFEIHKEILCQSKFMCNLLSDSEWFCCQNLEIFLPCSANELKYLVTFLYEGQINCESETNCQQILENLSKIFGFPTETFVEECQKQFRINEDTNVIGIFKSENILPPLVEYHLNPSTIPENSNFNCKKVKEETLKKKKIWSCPICDDVFKNRNSFRDHIASVHKGKKPFKCSQCEIRFLHADSLTKHTSKAHNILALDDSEIDEIHYLNKCESNLTIGRKALEPITSVIHEVKEEGSYAQNLCNVAFETEALWMCPICDIDLKRKKKLRDHIKSSHQGQKVFRCSSCEARFELKDSLNRHLKKKHTIESPIISSDIDDSEMDLNETDISNLCESNLDIIGMNELDAHEESVIEFSDTKNSSNTEFEKEVLWICPICNIDLKWKKKLRDHIKSSHQGQKVFRCSLCEASFELKDSLKRHLKTKHVDQVTNE